VHDRRLGRIWLAATLLQVAVLVGFSALYVFVIDGQRYWAVSDDIYISACYARSIAHGQGAVWYPGTPPVEGFSNPLWTLLLALVQRLPLFREEYLGLFVLLLQIVLLAASSLLSFGVLRRLLALSGAQPELTRLRLAFVLVLSLGWSTLAYWQAEGFELGLVLVFGLWALKLALEPRAGAGRPFAIGLCCGLCLWTRMDGVLACLPALLLLALGPGRALKQLGWCALGAVPLAAALFAARHAVFGEWLPNTYWLKLTGWPLADRLARGVQSNLALLPALALAWAGLALPRVRRALGAALLPVLALLATATATLAYSCHNGGDSWNLRLGYDRFSAPGSLLLGLALVLVLLRFGATPRERLATALVSGAIALSPLFLDPSLTYTARLCSGTFQRGERAFVEFGRAFEACSKPGAKVALGAAGAIVYVSHRGAYDYLGKCDPWVARQPVNHPEMTSGHNKRYEAAIFERYAPEFSRVAPPAACAADYRECLSAGKRIWVRRDSTNALWDKLELVGN
jgi:hypothetical protein